MRPDSSINPRHARAGMTLVEVMALLVTLFVIATVVLPMLRPRRSTSNGPGIRCLHNLRQLSIATGMWASDHDDRAPWQVSTNQGGAMELARGGDLPATFQSMTSELVNPRILACPADPSRRRTVVLTEVTVTNISYFLNLSSASGRPGDFVFGDRNVLINGTRATSGLTNALVSDQLTWDRDVHKDMGNVSLVDGSVLRLSKDLLLVSRRSNQPATNLLVFP